VNYRRRKNRERGARRDGVTDHVAALGLHPRPGVWAASSRRPFIESVQVLPGALTVATAAVTTGAAA